MPIFLFCSPLTQKDLLNVFLKLRKMAKEYIFLSSSSESATTTSATLASSLLNTASGTGSVVLPTSTVRKSARCAVVRPMVDVSVKRESNNDVTNNLRQLMPNLGIAVP
uniref:Secreted protein n=1 Tax=Syphacia muris TaxID=451379 RepID=A0A0N5AVU5_9BILA